MKIRILFYSVSLLLLCATPLRAQPPTDAEVITKLVGTWDTDEGGVKGTDVFKNDGTFKGSATGAIQGTEVTIAVEGKWSVKDGVLTEEITRSDHPEFVPAGATTHDKLIEVTDKTFKARNKRGAEEIHVRH